MVSSEDVIAAYRLILGRDPEDHTVVAAHVQRAKTLAELRANFFSCPEFQARQVRPLDWPTMDIELDSSPSQLEAMREHIEENWRQLGISEPHWSVLSHEAFRAVNIEQTKNSFFESGKDFLGQFMATLRRCGVGNPARVFPPQELTCFELGCGIGRVTVWLSPLFKHVIAADISPSHLTLARQSLQAFRRDNVDLVHFDSFTALESMPEYDVFISVIVLQHNPPPLIASLLGMVLQKLKPGGFAYFQVPTYRLHYAFKIDEYLHRALPVGEMEMHVLPQHRLFQILYQNGCRLLECREDEWTGDQEMISNSIFAIKDANDG